jgi:hypothetical protein
MSDSTGPTTDDDPNAWARRPENYAIIAAAKAVSDAVKHEQAINDDDSENIAAAQKAVTTALAGFHAAAGADRCVLRLVVGFALDKPRASDAEVERILTGIEADPNAASESQRRIVREMTMRAVTALGLLSQRITCFAAWLLFLGVSGRKGVPGEVWEHTPTAGVDMDGGHVETFMAKLVDMIGYTAGQEGLLPTHRLTAPILSRALKAWSDMQRRSRFELPAIRPRTVRKWCGSTAWQFKLNEQFELAYQRGLNDRARKATDDSLLLPRI